MSQRQILVLIGVAIIVLPFLGFPTVWKQIFFVLTGIVLIVSAFKTSWKRQGHADTFSESHNQPL